MGSVESKALPSGEFRPRRLWIRPSTTPRLATFGGLALRVVGLGFRVELMILGPGLWFEVLGLLWGSDLGLGVRCSLDLVCLTVFRMTVLMSLLPGSVEGCSSRLR